MESALAVIAAVWCAILLAIHAGSAAATWFHAKRRPAPAAARALPPVSILVPVKGCDTELAANLRRLCMLDYPVFEIIVAIADQRDEAVPVVESIAAEHSQRLRLVIGREPISPANPKTETLAVAYRAAMHPLVLHCDANVALEPWRLRQAVALLDTQTGVVSAAFVGARPSGAAAVLECAFLNGYHARLLTAGAVIGHAHAEGKFALYRRADLERGGGFPALGASLSDEAALERVMAALGLPVRLLPTPVIHPLGRRTIGEVWRRQVRWFVLRRTVYPLAFLGEIPIGGAVAVACAAIAGPLFGLPGLAAAAAVAAFWYGIEALLVGAMRWPLSPASPVAWVARDLLAPAMLASALVRRRYTWRGEVVDRTDHTAIRLSPHPHAHPPEGARLRVLVHVFYPDLWPELSAYLANLAPLPFDLHVNIVDRVATPDLADEIRSRFPEARLLQSPNRGRDIGGFFALLADLPPEDDDIVCLLHTKRSPHMLMGGGGRWRRGLIDPLLGTPARARENVLAMRADRSLGLIAARRYRMRRMTENRVRFEELLDRLGIRGRARRCDFVAGTMMFLRGSVLRQLHEGLGDLSFEDGDSLSARQHLDGQVAHAVERVIGSVVRHQKLRCWWR